MSARRLLLLHAHPDDETINTGATMARYAAEGVAVTLVTCTLGEEGEILVPELAGLAAGAADQLGGYRIAELAAAMRHLGVTDHRFLGGAGRFRDSGMLGAPANAGPRAFWRAASHPEVFAAAEAALGAVLEEVRPQVVVTYDPRGGYGHPDHVMAHRVTMAAVARIPDAKVYWTVTPRAELLAEVEVVRGAAAAGQVPFAAADPGFGVPRDEVTTVLDASPYLPAKLAALAAHRTQVQVQGSFFALSDAVGRVASGVERYRLVRDPTGAHRPGRVETDLFHGVRS